MHDVRLPVSGALSDGLPVGVSALPLGHLTQIAGWEGFDAAARSALDLPFPPDFRTASVTDGLRIWRIAPDRLLIRSPQPLALAPSEGLVTLDLSDARIGLVIEGPGAAGLLARVTALDYAPKSFAPGTFAQTALHHVAILIERKTLDRFEILVPTSWAQSVIDLIAEHIDAGSVRVL